MWHETKRASARGNEVDIHKRHFVRFELGDVEDVVDQHEQAIARRLDQSQRASVSLGLLHLVDETGGQADDAVEGRAQFVRDTGEDEVFLLGLLLIPAEAYTQLTPQCVQTVRVDSNCSLNFTSPSQVEREMNKK